MGRARGNQAAAAVSDLNHGARFDSVFGARRSTKAATPEDLQRAECARNLDRVEAHLPVRSEIGDLVADSKFLLGHHQPGGSELHDGGFAFISAAHTDLSELAKEVAEWWSKTSEELGVDEGTPLPSFVVDLRDGQLLALHGARNGDWSSVDYEPLEDISLGSECFESDLLTRLPTPR